MKAFLLYAVASTVALALSALGISVLVTAGAAGVWAAAAIAWVVQLAAFAVLLRGRGPGMNFMVAWGGGVALRFVAVAATAIWLTSATELPAAPALLSLVVFVFVLALLEPVFLRRAG